MTLCIVSENKSSDWVAGSESLKINLLEYTTHSYELQGWRIEVTNPSPTTAETPSVYVLKIFKNNESAEVTLPARASEVEVWIQTSSLLISAGTLASQVAEVSDNSNNNQCSATFSMSADSFLACP